MNATAAKVRKCILRALPGSGRTCLWLLKIILPISLGVRLLQYCGLLSQLSGWMEPLFSVIGLPGETAIVFITSIFCPLYAPIAIISSMSLGVREATILALMCLVSHNLIVESSVQAKTGSGFWEVTILRLAMSFVIAMGLNLVMPHSGWGTVGGEASVAAAGDNLWDVLALWLYGSMKVVITILLIVTALMILHYILEEFRLMQGLSAVFAPLMGIFGLPRNTAFLWLVGNLVGLAYGGAIMVEQVEQEKLSYKDGSLLNYHLAVNHSMLEDTIIFVAIGIPVLWILITRLLFACSVVWIRRLYSLIAARYLSPKKI
ncbi:MAG: nucleoside recognition domain-containing protein [Tannerellaceae bacterium]|jgi:spore maturation protein SpmB|nr:nucleoside recognition domain-containing protein [Tannerellaceae bacterium]